MKTIAYKISILAVILLLTVQASAFRMFQAGIRTSYETANIRWLTPSIASVDAEASQGIDLFFSVRMGDDGLTGMTISYRNFQNFIRMLADLQNNPFPSASLDLPGATNWTYSYPMSILPTFKFQIALNPDDDDRILVLIGGLYRMWDSLYHYHSPEMGATKNTKGVSEILLNFGPGIGLGKTFLDKKVVASVMFYHNWGFAQVSNEVDAAITWDLPFLDEALTLRLAYNLLVISGQATSEYGINFNTAERREMATQSWVHSANIGIAFNFGRERD